jgi:hypothetical protein
MPRTPLSLTELVIAYFLAMTGLAFFGVNLAAGVTAQVIAFSLPHLAGNSPSPVSRVDQRRMAVAQAIPPLPVAKLAAMQMPAVSYDVLAAQLDSAEATAEADDVGTLAASPGRRRLALALRTRARVHVPAADAFNRSFGVIPIASN